MIKSIMGYLFIASVSVGAVGWFLGIIELATTALMQGFIYRVGKKVIDFEEHLSVGTDNFVTERLFETDSGQFKFVDSHTCIFRQKMPLFSMKVHTPFSLKGSVEFKGGFARVEGRLPLGATIFLCAWIFGWTIGCIMASNQPGSSDAIIAPFMLLFGWGVTALMYFPSVAAEKKRFLTVYDEIKQQLRY